MFPAVEIRSVSPTDVVDSIRLRDTLRQSTHGRLGTNRRSTHHLDDFRALHTVFDQIVVLEYSRAKPQSHRLDAHLT